MGAHRNNVILNEQARQRSIDAAENKKRMHELVLSGVNPYVHRFVFLPPVYAVLAFWLLLRTPTAVSLAVGVPVMFLCYDFYSGILHVNLDDKNNVDFFVLSQACLEFQWHHVLPHDSNTKSLMQNFADLNIIVGLSILVNFPVLIRSRSAAMLTALKLLFAFYGQFSHRLAHGPKQQGLLLWMQKLRLLLPKERHRHHHKPPHANNFCLIGNCDGAIEWLLHQKVNWFACWIFTTIFDIRLIAALFDTFVV